MMVGRPWSVFLMWLRFITWTECFSTHSLEECNIKAPIFFDHGDNCDFFEGAFPAVFTITYSLTFATRSHFSSSVNGCVSESEETGCGTEAFFFLLDFARLFSTSFLLACLSAAMFSHAFFLYFMIFSVALEGVRTYRMTRYMKHYSPMVEME